MFNRLTPNVQRELAHMGWGTKSFDAGILLLVESMGLADQLARAPSLTALFERLRPAQAAWLYYFLDSLSRGERLVNYANDQLRPGANFLDVGCGYGGSLVAAHRRGMNVYGIEVDSKSLSGTRALLEERGVVGNVSNLDVHGAEFKLLPAMDLIVCENVIEHVNDPRGFMQCMFERVAPGGSLVMEIPNGFSLRSVTSDPHYSLPFITLLPHASASQIFEDTVGRDVCGDTYSVGDYFPLSWYLKILNDAGAASQFWFRDDAIASRDSVLEQQATLRRLFAEIGETFDRTPPLLREALMLSAETYMDCLNRSFGQTAKWSESAEPQNPSALEATYLAAAWIVRFDKPSKRGRMLSRYLKKLEWVPSLVLGQRSK